MVVLHWMAYQQFHPGMDGFPAKVVQTVVWVCEKNGAPPQLQLILIVFKDVHY